VSFCHLIPIHTQKGETACSFLEKAKLLFFSVLLAFRQRNNHFCGCKGTHIILHKQHYRTIIYVYLTIRGSFKNSPNMISTTVKDRPITMGYPKNIHFSWFFPYLFVPLSSLIIDKVQMSTKEFIDKYIGKFVIWNLIAMIIVIIVICIGIKVGLDSYTHHGEGYELPDLYGTDFSEASSKLAEYGLIVVANDTGYNKKMDDDVILVQLPGAGTKVKEGRTIYVTINSTRSPKVRIPDVIDNSSYREAQARLSAIGFNLLSPKIIDGERDWVYGIMAGSKNIQAGDMVSIETPLMLIIGNGTSEDENNTDAMLDIPEDQSSEEDDFVEITEN